MEIVESTERIHYGTFVTDNQGRFSVQASPDEVLHQSRASLAFVI